MVLLTDLLTRHGFAAGSFIATADCLDASLRHVGLETLVNVAVTADLQRELTERLRVLKALSCEQEAMNVPAMYCNNR